MRVGSGFFSPSRPTRDIRFAGEAGVMKLNEVYTISALTKSNNGKMVKMEYKNETETFTLPNGGKIEISKRLYLFQKWSGEKIKNDYGGKAVLDYEGHPLFAELVILHLLEKEEWSGVWVDTYGKKFRNDLPEKAEPIILPADEQSLLDKISDRAGGFKGCWDVFAWKGNEYLFAESKRLGKDAIRDTQINWLSAALEVGVSPKSFLLIEWNLTN